MGKKEDKTDVLLKYFALTVNKAADIIDRFLPYKSMAILGITSEDKLRLAQEAVERGMIDDMVEYAEKDPAAKNDYRYIYESCKGFEAMIYYRVAHTVLISEILAENKNMEEYVRTIARKITEEGKVKTGIDINPAAVIGRGCVIDHGVGSKIGYDYAGNTSVIGETAIIGDRFTALNDVVIGANEVNKGTRDGRRHPIIGNDVTVCSGARILGPIKIGDNVFIGTHVIVSQDIPSNSSVTLQSQYQIIRWNKNKCVSIYGVLHGDNENTLVIGGENLKGVSLYLVVDDSTYREVEGPLRILSNTDKKVVFEAPTYKRERSQRVMLRVMMPDGTEVFLYSELLNKSA